MDIQEQVAGYIGTYRSTIRPMLNEDGVARAYQEMSLLVCALGTYQSDILSGVPHGKELIKTATGLRLELGFACDNLEEGKDPVLGDVCDARVDFETTVNLVLMSLETLAAEAQPVAAPQP